MKIIVKNNKERIDKFLAQELKKSRVVIGKMISSGFISVNNKSVKSSYKLKEDDEIEIKDGFKEIVDIVPEKMNINIVYEDNYIIVVNKPSGMVVHPGSGNMSGTLVNGLMGHTKELSDISGENRLGIVHRIDKDTSGLLLVAKNNEVHNILATGFKNKTIKREYIALLTGIFPHESATIDAPIGRDKNARKKMMVKSENAKEAVTHLQVIKRYEGFTLVKLQLETGRTHQIRVHMQYIGYPIYNDPIYNTKSVGDFAQFLHAGSLAFTHPITKEKMLFTVPLPKEYQEFIDNLEEKL